MGGCGWRFKAFGAWCGLALVFSSALTLAEVGKWRAPDVEVNKINPIRYDVDSVSKGGELFFRHCQGCHGYWGEGNGVIGPTLNGRPANLLRLAGNQSVGEFAWKIAEGRNDMPAFRSILSQTEIWQVVNFVESLENEIGSREQSPIVRRCAQCHGLAGRAIYEGWPNLADMTQREIADKLRAHRSQVIEDSAMSKVAFDLTDGEIEEAARFFSAPPSESSSD